MLKRARGIRSGAEKKVQRFLAIACDEDAVGQIFRAQGVHREVNVVLTIIDQENIHFI
jgi:hypothetical protein